MMKKYSLLIALFIGFVGFSQNYTGTLNTIEQNGLHKIMLTSKIRSATNDNSDFIRIQNAQKNEVPYVLIYGANRMFSKFIPAEIVSKQVLKDSVTSIIIENKKGEIQEHITLRIANTDVYKNYSIYGSNNKKDWFGLVENEKLGSLNSKNKTTVEKTIFFPLNKYKFIQINFNDKKVFPIDILDAGVYESHFFTQNPIEINGFKKETISIKDKKVTQLKFSATDTHNIDIILLTINTEFFLRNATIKVKKTRQVKKRTETYYETIDNFQLSSKGHNTFEVSNLNEKEFFIEIENEDNPPLNIQSVQFFQKPIYLVANLKKQEMYEMIVDTTLQRPSYDLGNFVSEKTNTIDEAFVNNFSNIEKGKGSLNESPFWKTSVFMWICIVLGGIITVYFALGLLKDIKNKENK